MDLPGIGLTFIKQLFVPNLVKRSLSTYMGFFVVSRTYTEHKVNSGPDVKQFRILAKVLNAWTGNQTEM